MTPPTRPAKKEGPSLYKEAFLNQYNLIFLAFMAIASLLLFSPWPLLVALGLEILYLVFVPDTAFFKRWVAARRADELAEERRKAFQERLDRLPSDQRERYDMLDGLVERTKTNMRRSQADDMHFAMIEKLSTLQERFLAIMELSNAYAQYLDNLRGQDLGRLEKDLERQIEAATGRLRKTLQERLDVLRKRRERMEQVRENQVIVQNQIHTVEDIMRLIFEASLTMQNPQGLSQQLDDLLIDVEATEESVSDLKRDHLDEAFDQLAADLDRDPDAAPRSEQDKLVERAEAVARRKN